MIRVERLDFAGPSFHGVVDLIIDRPEKRNALTPTMLAALENEARQIDNDPTVRAVVLRGEGRVFCAGFDLSLCAEDSAPLAEMLRGLSAVVRTLRRLSKPVVAAAHGAALAGGCALLGGADFVVTDQRAKIGYPVVTLGISPAVSAPTLRLAAGERAARERLLDPGLISGTEARRIGLADLCVDLPEDVIPRAQHHASMLAEKPPHAVAATKRWLNEIEGSLGDDGFDTALAASLGIVGNDEERTRLAALLGGTRG